MADATAYYERREEELTPKVMREVERQVMLRIIDQRWREHLEEMDYLKEGINLRAMGQKDPLTEWQREGYEMFGAMMKGIAQDFVRYVMHVQVVQQQPAAEAGTATGAAAPVRRARRRTGRAARGRVGPGRCSGSRPDASPDTVACSGAALAEQPSVHNLQTSSSDTEQPSAFRSAAEVIDANRGVATNRPSRRGGVRPQATKQETVVKDEMSKTPRNAPCPCGSGKKFKQCHGAS